MAYDTPRAPEGTKLVLIAVGLGLVAVILTLLWGERIKKANEIKTVKVCIFERSVSAGQTAQKDDYATIDLPESFSHTLFDVMKCLPPLQADNTYAGKEKYTHDAEAGELVRVFHFAESGPSATTGPPPGKVWVALPINSANASGRLSVKAHVNISAPFNKPGERVPRSITVMENVQIEALGQYTVEDVSAGPGRTMHVGGYRNFSIEVEPKEANLLADIRRMAVGDFELVVCNPTEKREFEGIHRQLLTLLNLNPVQLQ